MIYFLCKCHLLSFVLIFIAYCYAVSINFALLRKTRWTFLLVNVHLIFAGITRATITPLNGVDCFWHYCRLRHLRGFVGRGVLSRPIPYATALACHTGQLKSLMPSYLSCYDFFSTKIIWLVSFATSALTVSLLSVCCGWGLWRSNLWLFHWEHAKTHL